MPQYIGGDPAGSHEPADLSFGSVTSSNGCTLSNEAPGRMPSIAHPPSVHDFTGRSHCRARPDWPGVHCEGKIAMTPSKGSMSMRTVSPATQINGDQTEYFQPAPADPRERTHRTGR